MSENAQRPAVLFVDDEHGVRALAGRTITAAGYDFDQAADGNEALAKLEARAYQATVIDLIMPEREGIETIIEIRKRWPDLHVVAMSGGGRIGPGDFLNLAQMLGAHRILRKPFRAAELLAVLEPEETS